jgi:hypothetical protein
MDLQTIRAHDGAKWAWARTGALILFLVTGILLVASLATARSQQPGHASLIAGESLEAFNPFSTAG